MRCFCPTFILAVFVVIGTGCASRPREAPLEATAYQPNSHSVTELRAINGTIGFLPPDAAALDGMPGFRSSWTWQHVAAYGGWLIPFGSDIEDGTAWAVEYDYATDAGMPLVLGIRYLNLSFALESGDDELEAHAVLVVAGASDGCAWETAGCGVYSHWLLGPCWSEDENGDVDMDLAGGLTLGAYIYKGGKGKPGVGATAQCSFFFSDPHGTELDGALLMLGAYVNF